jgi:hypothetical protein
MAAKKTIDISDQGKFRQKMSLYLTSGHVLSQLEVGFITDFHSWSNCQFQMFCVFFVSCFYSYEKWTSKSLGNFDAWSTVHHLWGMIMLCKKTLFEVLYYPSFDSHKKKNAILKNVKIPNLAQKRSFPPLCGRSSGKCPLTSNGHHLHSRRCCHHLGSNHLDLVVATTSCCNDD